MDFSFSEEQSLLQDSVQRFIQNSYTFEERQKLIQTEEGFVWIGNIAWLNLS